jgi:CheY-like chemotaxis protein
MMLAEEERKILLLDDDERHLEALADVLQNLGFLPLCCKDPAEALAALENEPIYAIVDLFLAGDDGAELSNSFIRQELIPRCIRYGRLTSAPQLVPQDLQGEWVVHKRKFWNNPEEILGLLLLSVSGY